MLRRSKGRYAYNVHQIMTPSRPKTFNEMFLIPPQAYRGLLYSEQKIVRAKQKSVATAVTNFTKPGAQNKGDLYTGLG